jgi:hypothetical protein
MCLERHDFNSQKIENNKESFVENKSLGLIHKQHGSNFSPFQVTIGLVSMSFLVNPGGNFHP